MLADERTPGGVPSGAGDDLPGADLYPRPARLLLQSAQTGTKHIYVYIWTVSHSVIALE
jgi:hypothetical protein